MKLSFHGDDLFVYIAEISRRLSLTQARGRAVEAYCYIISRFYLLAKLPFLLENQPKADALEGTHNGSVVYRPDGPCLAGQIREPESALNRYCTEIRLDPCCALY